MSNWQRPRIPCPDCGKPMLYTSKHCRKCGHIYIGITQRHPRSDPIVRFWSYVDKSGGPTACWPWTKFIHPKGYGIYLVRGWGKRTSRTHRIAYELTYGPIPDDLYACHHCDNPACCNPNHIFIGTQKDNMQDAARKNRTSKGDTSWSHLHRDHYPVGESCPNAKLTDNLVREIRTSYSSGMSTYKLAQRFNVSSHTIWTVISHKSWKHVR